MREGLIRRSLVALAALSLLLFLTAAFALTDRTPQAEAADSETAALIGYFNQYRASIGVAALSTSASANADAQANSNTSVQKCGYTLPKGHSDTWLTYAYETAAQVWSAYDKDSSGTGIKNDIGNANYHSAGIGRAKSANCSLGYIWTMILDRSGPTGGTTPPHTPTKTPSPTPSKTPTPTPSKTPTQSPSPTSPVSATPTPTMTPILDPTPPTNTPNPSCAGVTDVGIQCTPTPTPTPTETPSPTPSPVVTPSGELPGDADCDHSVDSQDGILVLMGAAGFLPLAPCLSIHGVNCQGGVDIADVLAIISFLGQIPYELPFGCPPIGVLVTPAPTPVPTPSPTPTATPVPTQTPVPTDTPAVTPTGTPPASETPAPTADGAVHHCQLALVSYQLDTDLLDGELHCTPATGTSYDCYFGNVNASCVASADYPDYDCSFSGSDVADCTPQSGEPSYECYRNAPGVVDCLPTHVGNPSYECAISGGTVTCTSSDAPAPNFACTKQAVDFDCVAQP